MHRELSTKHARLYEDHQMLRLKLEEKERELGELKGRLEGQVAESSRLAE